jgi:hypothetical protein
MSRRSDWPDGPGRAGRGWASICQCQPVPEEGEAAGLATTKSQAEKETLLKTQMPSCATVALA